MKLNNDFNGVYETEDQIPVGGVFKNEYDAICWKVTFVPREKYGDKEIYGDSKEVIIVLHPAPTYVPSRLYDPYEVVYGVSHTMKVKEFYGTADQPFFTIS